MFLYTLDVYKRQGVSHANYYKEQIVRMDTLEDVYRVSAGVKRDLR